MNLANLGTYSEDSRRHLLMFLPPSDFFFLSNVMIIILSLTRGFAKTMEINCNK